MTLRDAHLSRGASLAGDGIPLHYGDQQAEYRAALENAVLMDRSHEGRLELTGRDRLNLMHRISTNDLNKLAPEQGAATIFTNPNARIIDRATVYHRGETALVLTEPGRGEPLRRYLQSNIFFNDEARIADLTPTTRQFVLHGPAGDAVMMRFGLGDITGTGGRDVEIGGVSVFAGRAKPVSGSCWVIIAPNEGAAAVWEALLNAGAISPAGSLTYNALRIRAGRPGVGRELSTDYIPLEVGLWDEVSFNKGCYTGQEIIARMESRGRLARTIVSVRLASAVDAPAPLRLDGREVGRLTSSTVTPDAEIIGIGLVKVAAAQAGITLLCGDQNVEAVITQLPGAQPPMVENN